MEKETLEEFKEGAKWQQKKSYSEKDMKQFAWQCVANFLSNKDNKVEIELVEVIIDRNNNEFEQFKKNNMEETLEEVNWKAVYEDSLSMQKCSNAGYESKIRELKSEIERMYSEEEVHNIITSYTNNRPKVFLKVFYNEWFEQFKK